ncbi:MAG: POT family MFS transporter [Verrucomicrobia bacterium]|nr:POT family MFS transporter [Verrucomicrobiota bacterium]
MSGFVSRPGAKVAATLSREKYRTLPDQHLTTMPPGVPNIIGNEAAERFSFYGMRAILIIFMTTYLMNAAGQRAVMGEDEASGWFHQFVSAVYWMPVFGALLSDGILGKYRTIFYISIVYCLGHLSLALNDTRVGLFLGLSLIAIGAGGIKPCVSANVGDQFGQGNRHLMSKVFGWFYLSINLGSTFSTWLCPLLLNDPRFGPHYAFALPGDFMFIATVVFWLGRKKFVHIPAGGFGFVREFFSKEGLLVLFRLSLVYIFVAVFWALWDQSSGGEWTLQAAKLNLNVFGFHVYPEQVQILNPILILILVPIFNYGIYPVIDRFFPLTPLRKIGMGLFLTAASFVVLWWIQLQVDAGRTPSVLWQTPGYILLTAAEVMVSITGLEFSYTQAPRKMKSAVMALWLFAVSVGNQVTSAIDFAKPKLKGIGINLEGANHYAFFTLFMLVASVIFVVAAQFYRGKTYIQGVDEEELATAETVSS